MQAVVVHGSDSYGAKHAGFGNVGHVASARFGLVFAVELGGRVRIADRVAGDDHRGISGQRRPFGVRCFPPMAVIVRSPLVELLRWQCDPPSCPNRDQAGDAE